MKKSNKVYACKGNLVYSDKLGPGIIVDVFTIRKSQPKLMSVLFGESGLCSVYETELKMIQNVEGHDNGAVCITFNHNLD